MGIQRHLRVVATTRVKPLHVHMHWIPAATGLTIVNSTQATTPVDVGPGKPVHVDANTSGPYDTTHVEAFGAKGNRLGKYRFDHDAEPPTLKTWNVLWP